VDDTALITSGRIARETPSSSHNKAVTGAAPQPRYTKVTYIFVGLSLLPIPGKLFSYLIRIGNFASLSALVLSLLHYLTTSLEPQAGAHSGHVTGLRVFAVKKLSLFVASLLLAAPALSSAQNISTEIQSMKTAYEESGSGSIVALDGDSIVISPKMPSPICGLLMTRDGKTGWAYYSFPLSSITVPLASVDENLIADNRVFTDPNVAEHYKPGDVGETTMVIISGMPGKQFRTLIYDRDKFAQLGPGPHSSRDYGQAPDDTEAFGLTFSDPQAAHEFEVALKQAVIMAKQKLATQARR
jgi:hypothetical protein